MNPQLSRRDLFSRFARAFQLRQHETGAPVSGIARVAVIQGRHCLALTSFCATCVERCPVVGAMNLRDGMPQVSAEVCTGCGICRQVCPAPTNAVLMLPRQRLAQRQPVNSHEC